MSAQVLCIGVTVRVNIHRVGFTGWLLTQLHLVTMPTADWKILRAVSGSMDGVLFRWFTIALVVNRIWPSTLFVSLSLTILTRLIASFMFIRWFDSVIWLPFGLLFVDFLFSKLEHCSFIHSDIFLALLSTQFVPHVQVNSYTEWEVESTGSMSFVRKELIEMWTKCVVHQQNAHFWLPLETIFNMYAMLSPLNCANKYTAFSLTVWGLGLFLLISVLLLMRNSRYSSCRNVCFTH